MRMERTRLENVFPTKVSKDETPSRESISPIQVQTVFMYARTAAAALTAFIPVFPGTTANTTAQRHSNVQAQMSS
ncbi:MAG: hypothetical protein ACLTH3_11090 [Lachnospira sp.]